MPGTKSLIGICILSALALSAFAAPSASATHTTAVTCGKGLGATDFTDAHCKSGGAGEFGHEEFAGTTPIIYNNVLTGIEREVAKLTSVQSGITLEFQSKVVEGEGELENTEVVNKKEEKEGVARGSGILTFKEVTVTAPAGKGCVVKGGEIKTNKLVGTTQEQTNAVTFAPETGELIAEFAVQGCSVIALNHFYKAVGAVKAPIVGATLKFTHVGSTEQNTLFLSGQKAGIEGSLTLSGPGNPLTTT